MNYSNATRNIDFENAVKTNLIHSYAVLVLSIIGFIFNSLVCYVLNLKCKSYRHLDRFIAQLSLTDLLTSFIFIYNQIFFIIYLNNRTLFQYISSTAADVLCKISTSAVFLTITNSNLTLAAISVDRYRAIIHPLVVPLSRKIVTIIIAINWLISIAIAIFFWFYHGFGSYNPQVCIRIGNQYEIFAIMTSFGIIAGTIPVLVVFLCYGAIIKKILISKPPIDNSEYQQQQKARFKERNRRIAFLLFVTSLSLATSTLFIFIQMFVNIGDLLHVEFSSRLSAHFWTFFQICITLSILPTVINPVLYNFVSSNFQHSISSAIQAWKESYCCWRIHHHSSLVNGTRTA